MVKGYGQYCPLSLAVELLGRRWMLLIVSRLLDGCAHFNEIHRGVPRISPSLLSQRLSELEKAGLIRRKKCQHHAGREYLLTEAGRELEPLIDLMAVWGQKWARDMTDQDLDPAFLVWSMHLRMNTSAMPPGRTVIEFQFSGAPADRRQFWLVNTDGVVDMCLKNPGVEIDLLVTSPLRLFVEAWRGFRDLRKEIAAERIKLAGPANLRQRFPAWLRLSALAPYPRLRPGRERRLTRSTVMD